MCPVGDFLDLLYSPFNWPANGFHGGYFTPMSEVIQLLSVVGGPIL